VGYRIVEVGNPADLRLHLRHLIVERDGTEVGRVPLEDMGVLLVDGPGIRLTRELLAACAAHTIAVVVSDERHLPASVLMPLEGHSLHALVLRQQVAAAVPRQKQVWRQIVQAKLTAQAELLQLRGLARPAREIHALVSAVQSGDPTNRESVGAAIYFGALFGDAFTRDRDAPGTNAMLNYGYAVLRATVARALVATGLHPALGICHHNRYNPLALADDVMEPVRPLVDRHVREMIDRAPPPAELDPPTKRDLLKFVECNLNIAGKQYPFATGLEVYAASFKQALCETARRVTVPRP